MNELQERAEGLKDGIHDQRRLGHKMPWLVKYGDNIEVFPSRTMARNGQMTMSDKKSAGKGAKKMDAPPKKPVKKGKNIKGTKSMEKMLSLS